MNGSGLTAFGLAGLLMCGCGHWQSRFYIDKADLTSATPRGRYKIVEVDHTYDGGKADPDCYSQIQDPDARRQAINYMRQHQRDVDAKLIAAIESAYPASFGSGGEPIAVSIEQSERMDVSPLIVLSVLTLGTLPAFQDSDLNLTVTLRDKRHEVLGPSIPIRHRIQARWSVLVPVALLMPYFTPDDTPYHISGGGSILLQDMDCYWMPAKAKAVGAGLMKVLAGWEQEREDCRKEMQDSNGGLNLELLPL